MRKLKYGYIYAGAIIIIFWLCIAITIFLSYSSKIETQKIEKDLSQMSKNNINTVNFLISEYARSLVIGARGIEKNPRSTNKIILTESLEDIAQEGGFLYVSLDTPDSIINDNHTIPFGEAIDNGVFISDVYFDAQYNEFVVAIKIPMESSFEKCYLNGRITTKQLSNTLDKSLIFFDGFFHIVDGNGSYVATSDTGQELYMDQSFIDSMPLVTYVDGYTFEEVSRAFFNGESGLAKYSLDGSTRYIYYMHTGINSWMITSIATKEVVEKQAVLHQQAGIALTVSILIVIVFFFVYILLKEKRTFAEAQLMKKSIQTLADTTHKVIVEWDYKTHELRSVSDFEAVFGRKMTPQDIRDEDSHPELTHPDDIQTVKVCFNSLATAKPIVKERFRIIHGNGSYIWCEFSSTVIRDQKGQPVKAFCFLENIDDDIRHAEELKKTAELDSLTQVYNKMQTESLITYELNHLQGKTSALFILDFDNFKQLNDTFGHQKGDEVLKELTNGLKRVFRTDDIIGRIGGDEFFIYLKNIDTIESVQKKASIICQNLKKTYSKDNKNVEITFSIGIALAPQHGADFKTLYKAADKSLYQVKKDGKNNYKIFENT